MFWRRSRDARNRHGRGTSDGCRFGLLPPRAGMANERAPSLSARPASTGGVRATECCIDSRFQFHFVHAWSTGIRIRASVHARVGVSGSGSRPFRPALCSSTDPNSLVSATTKCAWMKLPGFRGRLRTAVTTRPDVDALDFVEGDLFLPPIVELCRASELVHGGAGRDFEVAAVAQVVEDSDAAKAVDTVLGRQPRLAGAGARSL